MPVTILAVLSLPPSFFFRRLVLFSGGKSFLHALEHLREPFLWRHMVIFKLLVVVRILGVIVIDALLGSHHSRGHGHQTKK